MTKKQFIKKLKTYGFRQEYIGHKWTLISTHDIIHNVYIKHNIHINLSNYFIYQRITMGFGGYLYGTTDPELYSFDELGDVLDMNGLELMEDK